MNENIKEEYLLDVIYIDINGIEYDIKDINNIERFRTLYNSFHIFYRPLIKIFKENKCVVTFNDDNRDEIFKVSNVTEKVRTECLKYKIKI